VRMLHGLKMIRKNKRSPTAMRSWGFVVVVYSPSMKETLCMAKSICAVYSVP
jgi:hypothetical protein